jgi:hypothetical protein
MNERNLVTLVLVVAGSLACESGDKRIGSLEGADSTETGDEGTPADVETGETGENCMGNGDPIECTEPQGVSFSWNLMAAPGLEDDVLWTCAANAQSKADGHEVLLTHCSDSQGQPQADTRVYLTGDGPEPEFADGDQPLTEFRFIVRSPADHDYTAIWMILRPVGQERVSLLGFTGTKMVIDDPSYLSPLTLGLADIGCAPESNLCSGGWRGLTEEGQVTRIGVAVDYGCARGIVAESTMLTDLGLEEETGTVYDVLVTMANRWQCPDEGGNLLELVIVGRTI